MSVFTLRALLFHFDLIGHQVSNGLKVKWIIHLSRKLFFKNQTLTQMEPRAALPSSLLHSPWPLSWRQLCLRLRLQGNSEADLWWGGCEDQWVGVCLSPSRWTQSVHPESRLNKVTTQQKKKVCRENLPTHATLGSSYHWVYNSSLKHEGHSSSPVCCRSHWRCSDGHTQSGEICQHHSLQGMLQKHLLSTLLTTHRPEMNETKQIKEEICNSRVGLLFWLLLLIRGQLMFTLNHWSSPVVSWTSKGMTTLLPWWEKVDGGKKSHELSFCILIQHLMKSVLQTNKSNTGNQCVLIH